MEELRGRRVMAKEIAGGIPPEVSRLPAMEMSAGEVCCLRCGTKYAAAEVWLATNTYYCPACIQMGRVTSEEVFYHLPEQVFEQSEKPLCFWKGELTEGQKQLAAEITASVKKKEARLIWAVTGAGKTEMLFAGIEQALMNGERVAIASPRVDVCLELYPRVQAAFPKTELCLLHGAVEEPYRRTQLVICTTHQLLRFYQAFDLLIIDEVDAFPFVDDAVLGYAVAQAQKPAACLIYLTATPTETLLGQIERGELAYSLLPARFHRQPLPVPQLCWCQAWRQKLRAGKLPQIIIKLLQTQLTIRPVLIFCPEIALIERLAVQLQRQFPEARLTSVFAGDPERAEKVKQMRQRAYDFLLTSTILERGVTFPNISVMVLGANHRVFTTAALVQIAGRVGRALDYPDGAVWFLHDGQTRQMKAACRQIKQLNQTAMERGLLDAL